MFDILAIDWGEKRCGMAFGSSETELILQYQKECFTENVLSILAEEIEKRKIKTIVLGYPTNFTGNDTEVTLKIRNFESQINKIFPDIVVIRTYERNTTKAAKEIITTNEKHQINHQAAANILNNYFYKINLQK